MSEMSKIGEMTDRPEHGPSAADEPLRLRLYVAAAAPNSLQAIANLRALLQSAGVENAALEIVDCIREPQRALRDGVLVTPTLLKLAPPPTCTIVGALSDRASAAAALGLADAVTAVPAAR